MEWRGLEWVRREEEGREVDINREVIGRTVGEMGGERKRVREKERERKERESNERDRERERERERGTRTISESFGYEVFSSVTHIIDINHSPLPLETLAILPSIAFEEREKGGETRGEAKESKG